MTTDGIAERKSRLEERSKEGSGYYPAGYKNCGKNATTSFRLDFLRQTDWRAHEGGAV